jgi:mevalonate kinase
MIKDSMFYAKILLFGEYGIIEDSMGLSIPFDNFNGKFRFVDPTLADSNQIRSNKSIAKYVKHLKQMHFTGELPCKFDFARIESHIDKGLYFDSSIPQGFGVGSSGALVAAIYSNYAENPITAEDVMFEDRLQQLKEVLGIMESYFHGKSSGLDPMICYLNLPIIIKGKGSLDTAELPAENIKGKGAIFLLDSGSPGKTKGMVEIFLERLKEEGFRNMVKTELKKHNDNAVTHFLKGEVKPLFKNVKAISQLFFNNFQPMIPKKFESLWKKGLDTNAYYLKLCGSGGGGFVLGFTEDFEQAQKLLEGHNVQVIYRM